MEAHVAHILRALGEDERDGLIEEEAAFIWERLADVALNDVLTKRRSWISTAG